MHNKGHEFLISFFFFLRRLDVDVSQWKHNFVQSKKKPSQGRAPSTWPLHSWTQGGKKNKSYRTGRVACIQNRVNREAEFWVSWLKIDSAEALERPSLLYFLSFQKAPPPPLIIIRREGWVYCNFASVIFQLRIKLYVFTHLMILFTLNPFAAPSPLKFSPTSQ